VKKRCCLYSAEYLCANDDRDKNSHEPFRLLNSPQLVSGQSQIEPGRLIGTDLDAIAAKDAVLVRVHGKGSFVHRAAGFFVFPDIAVMGCAVVVADLIVGPKLQNRATGQNSAQMTQGTDKSTPDTALEDQP
jgi:hypothetical protein